MCFPAGRFQLSDSEDGFAYGPCVKFGIISGEVEVVDDSGDEGIHLLVHEGFGGGVRFVPTVSCQSRAFEGAALKVEENRVGVGLRGFRCWNGLRR